MWHHPAGSVALWGGRAQKRNSGLCPQVCLGESCPPALVLMPVSSVPPCMSLMPFKLLCWCWSSEGVSLSKSVCGFFERNRLVFQQFLPLTQFMLISVDKSYGDVSSWHWNPGLGRPVVGLGLLTPKISLLNFYPPHVYVGPAHSVSLPFLSVCIDVLSSIP